MGMQQRAAGGSCGTSAASVPLSAWNGRRSLSQHGDVTLESLYFDCDLGLSFTIDKIHLEKHDGLSLMGHEVDLRDGSQAHCSVERLQHVVHWADVLRKVSVWYPPLAGSYQRFACATRI